ncbi:MAG: glycosyltransferase [Ignavibacteriae bacterium]|nr:glycosyltransferase [Ignavibacteriota bacterium]NOG97405.1 glycosyltransferase [Ignavibacteriota bacterium]
MKICFATHDGVTIAKGGVYVKIMEFKKHYESRGIDVELFDIWNSVDRLKDFDLVHLLPANLALFNLARNLKFNNIKFVCEPVFFSNHSTNFLKAISSVDKLARKFAKGVWFDYGFIRDICEWSELVLPNTQTEADKISKGFGISESKIKVIQNGVSERFLHGDPDLFKKKYGLEKFILNVGHVGPYRKNMLRFIKAVNKIDIPAVIIGKISDAGETAAVMKEAEKNKNIHFISDIPNDSPLLASAYAACDTFVLPSLFETPGIAALEAALGGAKIVITKYGGTKDYFENYAEYVDPYSIENIQTAIEKSLNNNKSSEAKKYIQANFLWEQVAEKTLKTYESLIKK